MTAALEGGDGGGDKEEAKSLILLIIRSSGRQSACDPWVEGTREGERGRKRRKAFVYCIKRRSQHETQSYSSSVPPTLHVQPFLCRQPRVKVVLFGCNEPA